MIDFLTSLLFESLPLLLVFCAVAMAVAVAVHRIRHTRGSRRGIWAMLAVCVGLIVLQRLVVTDREALDQTVRTMARAVADGDVGTVGGYVDTGFRLGAKGRGEFIDSVNLTLQEYRVEGPRIFDFKAQVDGDRATVGFRAFCDVRRGGDVEYNFPSRWQLRFVRRAGRWMLEGIDLARYEPPIGTGAGEDLVPRFR